MAGRIVSGLVHQFGSFTLDEAEKQLTRDGEVVPISPRYFDALLLLVRNPGTLIGKDRFFDEVWNGVIVGDEALTQCIKSLRKALGDEHRDPQFIATVPKRGYRFVAPVTVSDTLPSAAAANGGTPFQAGLALAGTAGGAAAGLVGGFIYGVAAIGNDGSAVSILFVMTLLTTAIGALGGAGVSFGMAAANRVLKREWTFSILGAGAGGLVMGAAFNLFGTDTFHLLFGRAPADFTGGLEGAALGIALATGGRIGEMSGHRWGPAIAAGIGAGAAGVLVSLMGGKLMGGSLAALAGSFRDSRLELDAIGQLAGEPIFGPAAQTIAAGLEGLLFGLGVTGAILLRRRRARTV